MIKINYEGIVYGEKSLGLVLETVFKELVNLIVVNLLPFPIIRFGRAKNYRLYYFCGLKVLDIGFKNLVNIFVFKKYYAFTRIAEKNHKPEVRQSRTHRRNNVLNIYPNHYFLG